MVGLEVEEELVEEAAAVVEGVGLEEAVEGVAMVVAVVVQADLEEAEEEVANLMVHQVNTGLDSLRTVSTKAFRDSIFEVLSISESV